MASALPRGTDDDRLTAVGRALAHSLLVGGHAPPDLRREPAAAAAVAVDDAVGVVNEGDLRTASFIPPPSGVSPGIDWMEPPRRRRTRPVAVPEPATEPVTGLVAEPPGLLPDVVRNDIQPIDSTELRRSVGNLPEAEVPQVARVRAAQPAATPEPSRPDPPRGPHVTLEPFAPAADPATTAARTSAGDSPAHAPDVDAYALELYDSLPWSPDEIEPRRDARPRRRFRLRSNGRKATPPSPTPIDDTSGPIVETTDSGFLPDSSAAAWIATHPIVPRPDPATVRLPTPSHAPGELDSGPTKPRSALVSFTEWFAVILAALAVALLIQHFVVQTFSIPSESMFPTLKIDDRVVVNKLAYDVGGDIERFDVLVFRPVDGAPSAGPDAPEYLIKRVIGLPGETIEARGGVVYIDGKPLAESDHLVSGIVTNNIVQPYEIPAGHFFMMGDNRERSGDSRIFGPVPRQNIVGRAMAVWWPLDRAGSL